MFFRIKNKKAQKELIDEFNEYYFLTDYEQSLLKDKNFNYGRTTQEQRDIDYEDLKKYLEIIDKE